ncbi:MAG: tRNA (adenosine(37)-N6)-threonylcarbamoyltransferase complex dimerization subunit type 1 TsaB [Erythrobacter sp.]
MRTLVIDTASEACSVALFGDDGTLLASDHQVIGRGHAEALVPMIAALPERSKAEHILVSLGPGSFTGVRIGLATARALGLAWGAGVRGYPTLALVAAMAQARCGPRPVTVCMNGGHGEWFIGDFASNGLPDGDIASLAPEAALARTSALLIAGNRAEEWAALDPASAIATLPILPDARFALAIPPALLRDDLAPIYGRPPDAAAPARHSNPPPAAV